MAGNDTPTGWWMYQNGQGHGGYVSQGPINASNASHLTVLHQLQLNGPVLSVPAVTNGYAYVGVANYKGSYGGNGGCLYKIELSTGAVANTYIWDIPASQRDSHGFTGMGCTPAVANGYVYFSAFDGKLYALNDADLSVAWITDLRYADPMQNQPVTNDMGSDQDPPAAGWSSPLVANGDVYVGMGEGENDSLFGFVYCLDGTSGKVKWIFCTSQFDPPQYDSSGNQTSPGTPNGPNQIPQSVVRGKILPDFTAMDDSRAVRGASVWSCIAYDPDLNRLYVSTGNPPGPVDKGLPTPPNWKGTPQLPQPYTYSILALDATAGTLLHTFTPTQDTCYRPSDLDVDFGGSPILYTQDGNKRVAVANKNGTLFVLDQDLNLLVQKQMLPYDTSGNQIPTVDPHPIDRSLTPLTPSNDESNAKTGENYSGAFGAPAVDPVNGRLFVGLGGPNYHNPSPGIDFQSTPFMRAVDWNKLQDPYELDPSYWPMTDFSFATPQGNVTVSRYAASPTTPTPPDLGWAGNVMFRNPGEGCIGSPMVVNGVAFVGTQGVSLYAFDSATGKALWMNRFGQQTLGLNGGYGYCMGAASDGTYVVAGALIYGLDGGMLRIYSLSSTPQGG